LEEKSKDPAGRRQWERIKDEGKRKRKKIGPCGAQARVPALQKVKPGNKDARRSTEKDPAGAQARVPVLQKARTGKQMRAWHGPGLAVWELNYPENLFKYRLCAEFRRIT